MEYMWGGMGSDVGVSELVLMSIIWIEICVMASLSKYLMGKEYF